MSQHNKPMVVQKQTTCPYCGVGCGVDVNCIKQPSGELSITGVEGTSEHPANFGRLCVKGSNLAPTITHTNRLFHPMVNGKRVNWEDATGYVADKLQRAIAEYGPDSVAFYVSGQLLTEDYYIANKLMKGFIGSGNIDTNSRLCMSSAVAAYKRAFGADAVPCNYEDLELTDLLILTGSNAAWTHPVLYQRMERAKKQNPEMKVVVVDPRRNASCDLADLHLPLKPGTDTILFSGLLAYLLNNNALDQDYIDTCTNGFAQTASIVSQWTLAEVANQCELDAQDVALFYQWFATLPEAITFFSMGINQSTTGVDKGNAIINCHLASGKIGRPGSGPFSITGQPNAMGGREVGGLANMLAAHMEFGREDHWQLVSDFWQAPNLAKKPGLKAVDLFDEIATGNIKFVWVMATNPVVSMPNRDRIEAALANCETVVVSDVVAKNDTIRFADVVLPATGWVEKDGTVTNSERRISRQRGIMPAAGEARHDWQIMCDVAIKMGFKAAFNFTSPAAIFDEYARLTAYQNNGSRDLDLSGLIGMNEAQYNALKPIQWPVNAASPLGTPRLFTDGHFYTESGKANFIPVTPQRPAQLTNEAFPFVLNTGRMRDQWHTMTRTGNASVLLKHTSHATLAMHPEDMQQQGFDEGQLVSLRAECTGPKAVILPVFADTQVKRNNVFAPIHWSETWGSHCAIGRLFNGANDAISGQPELKHGAVNIKSVDYAFYGLLMLDSKDMSPLMTGWFDYWTRTPQEHAGAIHFATNEAIADVLDKVTALWGKDTQITSLHSDTQLNLVITKDNRIIGSLWMANCQQTLPLEWLDHVFSQPSVTPQTLQSLLRRQPDDAFLQGKVVCSCYEVREKPIVAAIKTGCNSVEQLGSQLKCGTNCGSCRSELGRLLAEHSSESDDESRNETTSFGESL